MRAKQGESSLEGWSWWGWKAVEVLGSKGVVVAVLGLAEFVEEEDHGLQAQNQHYPTYEASSVKRVLVRFGRGRNWRDTCVGCSCDKRQSKGKWRYWSYLCLWTLQGRLKSDFATYLM